MITPERARCCLNLVEISHSVDIRDIFLDPVGELEEFILQQRNFIGAVQALYDDLSCQDNIHSCRMAKMLKDILDDLRGV